MWCITSYNARKVFYYICFTRHLPTASLRSHTIRSTSMNRLVQAMGEAGVSDAEQIVQSLPTKVLEELKKLLANKDSVADESEVKLSFWDFAGQQVFYTTHQTFLSHRAIYLLVLDLTHDLKHPIKTERQGRHGKVLDKACPQNVGRKWIYKLIIIVYTRVNYQMRHPNTNGCIHLPLIKLICCWMLLMKRKVHLASLYSTFSLFYKFFICMTTDMNILCCQYSFGHI